MFSPGSACLDGKKNGRPHPVPLEMRELDVHEWANANPDAAVGEGKHPRSCLSSSTGSTLRPIEEDETSFQEDMHNLLGSLMVMPSFLHVSHKYLCRLQVHVHTAAFSSASLKGLYLPSYLDFSSRV